jgi:hypothetical protein
MAWKQSTLKHSQTFSCAKFDFMDMLLELYADKRFKSEFAPKRRKALEMLGNPPLKRSGRFR